MLLQCDQDVDIERSFDGMTYAFRRVGIRLCFVNDAFVFMQMSRLQTQGASIGRGGSTFILQYWPCLIVRDHLRPTATVLQLGSALVVLLR